jgi:hypothetical protein
MTSHHGREERRAAMIARRGTPEWRAAGEQLAAEQLAAELEDAAERLGLPSSICLTSSGTPDSSGLRATTPATNQQETANEMMFNFEIHPELLATAEAVHGARQLAKAAEFEGHEGVAETLTRTLRTVLRDAVGPQVARLVIEAIDVRQDLTLGDAISTVLSASLRPTRKPRTKVVGGKKATKAAAAKKVAVKKAA